MVIARTWLLVIFLLLALIIYKGNSEWGWSSTGEVQIEDVNFEPLRNQHIVMIGDSVMRYQYLALAFLVLHKTMTAGNSTFDKAIYKRWSSWHEFFIGTNAFLGPNEYCDCFRPSDKDTRNIVENRYFYDPALRLNITYIHYFGDMTRGHWENHQNSDSLRSIQDVETSKRQRWSRSLHDFTDASLPHLQPRPTVLIVNVGFHARFNYKQNHARKNRKAGMHQWHTIDDIDHWIELHKSAIKTVDRFMYKTTTYELEASLSPHITRPEEAREKKICSIPSVICFDTSWTKNLNNNSYTDRIHFKGDVYDRMNVQLIGLLNQTSSIRVEHVNNRVRFGRLDKEIYMGKKLKWKNKRFNLRPE